MKIAAITNSRVPSLTANSIQAMKVVQAMLQLGHEVRLLAPREAQMPAEQALLDHYGLQRVPELEQLRSVPRLKRFDFIFLAQQAARRFGADLIYTWLPQSAALASGTGLPVVLEMHADVAGRMGAWWLRRFWKGRAAKCMTVTTLTLKEALSRSTGMQFPEEQALVAPNGVELERYESLPGPEEARRQLGLPPGLTAGFTGHIYPGRGPELLFALAQQLSQLNFLWVGGTPELVEHWRTKLESSGVSNVTMTGFIEHRLIPLHQAAADILLMPYSRSIEGSSGQDIGEVINPMKMFEYMAAGRLIVSADLPSIREVLNEGNAVLCEPGDAEAWRSAISALLADEPRRLELGARARADVERFTWLAREQRILSCIMAGKAPS